MVPSDATTNRSATRCPMCGEDPCEFCDFLARYRDRCRARGERDAGFHRAGKIVKHLEDGSEELVAWMPLHDEETTFSLHGSTEVHVWKHGTVLLAEQVEARPGYFNVIGILKKGG